jgi:hypothetical protein
MTALSGFLIVNIAAGIVLAALTIAVLAFVLFVLWHFA